jgi:hypothetical protein
MSKLVEHVRASGEDYEWYPTTDEMIEVVAKHYVNHVDSYRYHGNSHKILDCGAGDGRVLMGLNEHFKSVENIRPEFYAIEKASILRNRMDDSIRVIGTDFHEQNMIDKDVTTIFCNPPYSEFEQWMTKIITQSMASNLYFIVPQRWKDSDSIIRAIKKRVAGVSKADFDLDKHCTILKSYESFDGERHARAKVDVLYIKIGFARNSYNNPFDIWFDETFPSVAAEEKQTIDEKVQHQLVDGKSLIHSLVDIYNHEMFELNDSYAKFVAITPLLIKLRVDTSQIKNTLKDNIQGKKKLFWGKVFNLYTPITQRLTSKSKDKIMKKLLEGVSIDFSFENVMMITEWVIKNANSYFDSQFVEIYEQMMDETNVVKYKSNRRVIESNKWRYSMDKSDFENCALDYRIVVSGCGINTNDYSWDSVNNLSKNAADMYDDLLVIAQNLRFDTSNTPRCAQCETFEAGKAVDFKDNSGNVLFSARPYLNGNTHFKFDKKFLMRMNVEFGRLKGWITTPQQADEELNVKGSSECFGSSFKFKDVDCVLLLTKQ